MLKKIYHLLRLNKIKDAYINKKISILYDLMAHGKIDDKKYLIKMGKIYLGYKMNLDLPKTFNEKINWYKINYLNDVMTQLVDKIEVKKYIMDCNLKHILIPTIKEYASVNDIILDDLPQKFVIKNSIDSGGVFVCRDKNQITIEDIKNKLNIINSIFLNGKHKYRELAYEKTNNRIIVEELLETEDNHSPMDYKFFCFNGEPRFLFVGSERDIGVKFDFYDIDFNWLNVRQGHENNINKPKKPCNYSEMLNIARILSKNFPHVRVDLYNINGKIYFGEMTFYHDAGLVPFSNIKWDYEFGKYFELPNINIINSK